MDEQLIVKMQTAMRDYLMPETYVRKSPGGSCRADSEVSPPSDYASEQAKVTKQRERDQMFINDIIYFLDSAEHGTNQPC